MVNNFYSREKINKAGSVLAGLSNDFSKEEASLILENFRSIHIRPMFTFRINLVRKIKKLGLEEKSLLSQRLKRTPSIIQKLKINKSMSLSRMQDVGGLRVVLEELEKIYALIYFLKKHMKINQHSNTLLLMKRII
jgi:putative GTP pyrophosphokinase